MGRNALFQDALWKKDVHTALSNNPIWSGVAMVSMKMLLLATAAGHRRAPSARCPCQICTCTHPFSSHIAADQLPLLWEPTLQKHVELKQLFPPRSQLTEEFEHRAGCLESAAPAFPKVQGH